MTCPYTHILVDNHLQPCRNWGRDCNILLESLRRHLGRFLEGGGFRAEEEGFPPGVGAQVQFFLFLCPLQPQNSRRLMHAC